MRVLRKKNNMLLPIHFFFTSPVLLLAIFLLPPVLLARGEDRVESHEIHISFDLQSATLSGTSRIQVLPNRGLTLDGGPLAITGAVLNRADAEALVLQPGDDNSITLEPAATQRRLLVSWELRADDPMGTDNLIGANGITLAGFWHPVPDRDMLYTVTADLPRGFTAVTEADRIVETTLRGRRQMKASFPHPLPGVHFVAGPYKVAKRKVSDTTTLYTYFFPEDEKLADEYLQQASCYLERYEKLIGPYPYARFAIVENRLPTGYGMPAFTLLGQAVVRLPFIKDTSLGHEILHSWFGNSIFLKDGEGNWCEGLTTYLADQAYAADSGKGSEYRKNQLLRYQAYVHDDNDLTLADFRNSGDGRPSARTMRTIGYDRGSMLFHMLRTRIGDEAFFKGLQRFYKEKRYERAGWSDIEAVFSAVSGRDLGPFFSTWLSRPDIPGLSVRHAEVEQSGQGFRLSFTLVQANDKPFDLTVPLVVETVLDTVSKKIRVSERETTVHVDLDTVPLSLTVDPRYDILRKLSSGEMVPTWSGFIGAAGKKVVVTGGSVSGTAGKIYTPFLTMLTKAGCTVIKEEELTNSDLQKGSYLFLGASAHTRALFARSDSVDDGVVVDIRANPLAEGELIVMITSSSEEQSAQVVRKLKHYGKYSYLRFRDGRSVEKKAAASSEGIIVVLGEEPAGVAVRQTRGFGDIIAELGRNRVVYIGETHTDYGNHLMQLQIIQGLHRIHPRLAIGMEMFPRAVQPVLDDYIQGRIKDEKEFLKKSGYFSGWGYDYRFYRPVINFARKNHIPVIGLNLKKEIVSTIFRQGHTDELSPEQLAEIPEERDLDLPGYRRRLAEIHAVHGSMGGGHSRNFSGFIQAQALWDETMAESVVNFLNANPGMKMVVLAGTGHIYKDSAIPPRVARRLAVSQVTVAPIYSGEQGREQGKKLDYLLYTESLSLPPAPKIGVMLKEEPLEQGEGEAKGEKKKSTRMRVAGISPHGKAGEAGIKVDDIIITVDGITVETIDDIKIALLDKKAGDTAEIRLKRERTLLPDEELTVKVELSSMRGRKPPGHP